MKDDSKTTSVRVVAFLPKPHTSEQECFFVIANPQDLDKYRAGDTTIPLVQILESFDVYETENGSASGRATAFGTESVDEVLGRILRTGQVQPMTRDKHKMNHTEAYRVMA
ncbi:hypothetical protein BC829DRAFT_387333 [Chytridium lagenaria]|nr:hypothetical protein BC829DRAFT_387333 [Chytridium lagenaria]